MGSCLSAKKEGIYQVQFQICRGLHNSWVFELDECVTQWTILQHSATNWRKEAGKNSPAVRRFLPLDSSPMRGGFFARAASADEAKISRMQQIRPNKAGNTCVEGSSCISGLGAVAVDLDSTEIDWLSK